MLAAYGGRAAISHLPEPRLLDAAHIIMDADEQLGQPVVSNGLPFAKLHHAAFVRYRRNSAAYNSASTNAAKACNPLRRPLRN